MTVPHDARRPIEPGSPARTDDLSEPEFQRVVGRWAVPSPDEVAGLFAGSEVRWWLCGGWALELAGAPRREHKDTDVAFAAADLPALRRHAVAVGWDVWAPSPNGYRPLLPGDAAREDEEQFWVRRSATDPWLLDLLATPVTHDVWTLKQDARVHRPLPEVVRTSSDGVPYLAPEVCLLHQAVRPDPVVLRSELVALLDRAGRDWLVASLRAIDAAHPWVAELA